jgi:hypothetical protein
MAAKADTEIDTDPTGMYAMARQTHQMALRNRVVRTRTTVEQTDETVDASTVVFAEMPEDEPPHPVFAVLDQAFASVSPPVRTNGWVPTRPKEITVAPPPAAIERRAISITELDAPPPSSAERVFPTLENPSDRVRKLWPDQTSPVYEEVDAEVTWPLTPTGRKAKRGPTWAIFNGLSFDDYMKTVESDFRRVQFEHRILMTSLDERVRA